MVKIDSLCKSGRRSKTGTEDGRGATELMRRYEIRRVDGGALYREF